MNMYLSCWLIKVFQRAHTHTTSWNFAALTTNGAIKKYLFIYVSFIFCTRKVTCAAAAALLLLNLLRLNVNKFLFHINYVNRRLLKYETACSCCFVSIISTTKKEQVSLKKELSVGICIRLPWRCGRACVCFL
jgi:hypothetical protein